MSTPVSPSSGRHAVILCHPDPESFNHSVAAAYASTARACGQQVVVRDLYALGFDPVLKGKERPTAHNFTVSADVRSELEFIRGSDVFVLVYPIWFGSPPAMLKGYVERVLGSGVAPDDIQKQSPTSLLGGKRLLSFSTSAAGSVWLNQQGQEGAMSEGFDQYLLHAFGMHSQRHMRIPHITATLSDRFAHQYFRDVEDQAQRTCREVAQNENKDPNMDQASI
ncbi:MAG: NAD(P)H-dependent oxidoreductase [Sphingomonas sp.]